MANIQMFGMEFGTVNPILLELQHALTTARRVNSGSHRLVRGKPPLSLHGKRASIKRPISVPLSPLSAVKCYPCRQVSLNYSESLLFHGGDTGSTPVRDATIQELKRGSFSEHCAMSLT
jgi:hypothetical protein